MVMRTAGQADEVTHECVVGTAGDIRSPILQQLWTHWRSLHHGARLPGRKDIDPLEIPQLLPYVMLLDVLGGGKAGSPDFRFRLVGTHVTLIHRVDNTGKRVSEAFRGEEYTNVLRLYRRTVAERAPIAYRGRPLRVDGRLLDYEIVHLPLADAHDRVNMILAGLEFTLRA